MAEESFRDNLLRKLKKLTTNQLESLGPRLQRPICTFGITVEERDFLIKALEAFHVEPEPDYPGYG